MKKLFMILPLIFLLCFTYSCQLQVREEEPAVDVEEIKSLIDECSRAWNEGDYEGYMALFDEKAVMLPPNAPAYGGMETIRTVYRNSFDTLDFKVAITTEEIHVSADLAFSRNGWKGTISPKDGSEPIVFDNKVITIYKKQPEGSWKIWRGMYSSNFSIDPPQKQ